MSQKFNNFSNASIYTELRFILIKWLAGRSVIIINAGIKIVERDPNYFCRLQSVNGGLFHGSSFYADESQMLEISQVEP